MDDIKKEKIRFSIYNFTYHLIWILIIGFLIFSLFYWSVIAL